MRDSISEYVYQYCAANIGETITASKLYTYIVGATGGEFAPDTPARILRKLRDQGVVSYYVPERRKGQYIITSVQ